MRDGDKLTLKISTNRPLPLRKENELSESAECEWAANTFDSGASLSVALSVCAIPGAYV
jgi:hypothetical protein